MMATTVTTPTETAIWLALAQVDVSASVCFGLLHRFGSAQALWQASEAELNTVLQPERLSSFLKARQTVDPLAYLAEVEAQNIVVLTWQHPKYPARLKEIPDPPMVLMVKGDVSLLNHPMALGVVGTRRCTHYGIKVTTQLIEQLAAHQPLIVSGMAAGIDTAAHMAALDNQCPTVAVFGAGLDVIYPARNRALAQRILDQGGALVSEYGLGAQPTRFRFPKRNRIVAGLSDGVLVSEAPHQSGALITARDALEANRQVFAVPGSIFSEQSLGANALIGEGAVPATSGHLMARHLGWCVDPIADTEAGRLVEQLRLPDNLPDTDYRILKALGSEPITFDALSEALADKNPGEGEAIAAIALSTALTMLELKGMVRSLPGGRYTRT
ncbi:MAG: DNA-processing protein DprA [Cyanobacteria bacterium HKST-UBA04]|nr:DNA-processing protein DprA [Cyanobacteria bacterium HKST-UBA04]